MDKILIQIKNNIIYFRKKPSVNVDQKKLINTNIISDNELIFSSEYIEKNFKIIRTFLLDLMKEQEIDTVYIYDTNVTDYILKICQLNSNLRSIVFKEEMNITHENCECIIKNKSISYVSFYSLYDFLTEYLDNNGVIVEVRKEMWFISNFANNNELNKYSALLYKKIITFNFPCKNEDIKDFETFISVNKYLKTIHINKCSQSDLEKVISTLINAHKKNVKILLHDNSVDEKTVNYIKKINKKFKKNYNISISISYSNSFLQKNMIPQTNLTILKACFLLVIIFCLSVFGYYFTTNYFHHKNDQELKYELDEYIINADTTEIIEKIEKETEKIVINDYIASLQTINKDVIGWIKVPGTTVDYPILHGKDNDYYLKHTIKNEYSLNGSIFMNYANTGDFKDDNSIIFGHNMLGPKIMFTDLLNISNKKWLENKENHIVKIETLYETLEYEIFSFYTINVTTDYMQTNYNDPLERYGFYNLLISRSEYDFGINLDMNSKIITLSTCNTGGTQRFVVHAVLKTT